MVTTVKRFLEGFKRLTKIFVIKEHEMEIGYPTDVKHVAHIGLDDATVNAPSWMKEFHASSEISSTSLSDQVESRGQSWASRQEIDVKEALSTPKASKKTRRVLNICKELPASFQIEEGMGITEPSSKFSVL